MVVARFAVLMALAGCGRFGFSGEPLADGALPDSGADAIVDRYAAAVLADLPVGYWRLGDSGTAIADASGNQFTGSVMGGVTLGQPSLYPSSSNSSARLDGATGFVGIGDYTALRIASQITLEAWINAASFDHAAAGQFPRVVHKGSIGNTGYALMAYQIGTTNTANLRIELEGLSQLGVTGATTLMPNTSYHVVGTWDGSFMRVYVNGSVDGIVASTGAIPQTTDLLEIGRRPDSQRYWAGLLDDVAVYNYALSPAQVSAHYVAGQ